MVHNRFSSPAASREHRAFEREASPFARTLELNDLQSRVLTIDHNSYLERLLWITFVPAFEYL